MDDIKLKYNTLCSIPCDINEHLPTLYSYATKCESVLELGVRGCISSWAFSLGLLNNGSTSKKLIMNDISECNIEEIMHKTKDTDLNIKYIWKNDLEIELEESVDITFIDTWHIYGQLKRELKKFAPLTNKYIIMHDTTVDEFEGETIRELGGIQTAIRQSEATGIPVVEIMKGLSYAIEEFLSENSNWVLEKKYTNNNGLTILRRV